MARIEASTVPRRTPREKRAMSAALVDYLAIEIEAKNTSDTKRLRLTNVLSMGEHNEVVSCVFNDEPVSRRIWKFNGTQNNHEAVVVALADRLGLTSEELAEVYEENLKKRTERALKKV